MCYFYYSLQICYICFLLKNYLPFVHCHHLIPPHLLQAHSKVFIQKILVWSTGVMKAQPQLLIHHQFSFLKNMSHLSWFLCTYFYSIFFTDTHQIPFILNYTGDFFNLVKDTLFLGKPKNKLFIIHTIIFPNLIHV